MGLLDSVAHKVSGVASNLPFDVTPGFNLTTENKGVVPLVARSNGRPAGMSSQDWINSQSYGGGTGFANESQDLPTESTNTYQSSQAAANQTAARAAASGIAQNNAYLDTQANDLRSLLGRTDTGLNQGLEKLNGSYQSQVNGANSQQAQATQDYADKRVATNKDKLGAYNTLNKNANNGYRSLAQIIGRASGSGSSAFQEALPDAVGRELSAGRSDANDIYAENLGQVDTAQKKTDQSFAEILRDLADQRNNQEQSLRTGIEGQRQNINSQLQQNAAQRAQNNGGGYEAVKAAQSPFQSAIDNSRNSVESFFNQFKPQVQAQQAAIAAPDLSAYEVDRAEVNAQNQGASDPTNPYSEILRKRLQEQS